MLPDGAIIFPERLHKKPFACLPIALRPSGPVQQWIFHQAEMGLTTLPGWRYSSDQKKRLFKFPIRIHLSSYRGYSNIRVASGCRSMHGVSSPLRQFYYGGDHGERSEVSLVSRSFGRGIGGHPRGGADGPEVS